MNELEKITFMNQYLEICPNCGKTFYQPLDKCCYCGSNFDLTSYQRNWRKWCSQRDSLDKKIKIVQKADFSAADRKLACAVIETADFSSLKKIVLAGYDAWDSYDNRNIISAARNLPFPEIIAFLVARGVNFRNLDGSVFISNLSEAIYYDFVEYARWFIEHGADFYYREKQRNGCFMPVPIAYVKSIEMADMLIEYGANPYLRQVVSDKKEWLGQLIEKAEHVSGFILAVTFKNGEQKIIDIKPYICMHKGLYSEMIKNPKIISQLQYDSGEVFWNDLMGIEAHTLYNMKNITE